MTAFGNDGIQPDLPGKFKFTKREVVTTMMFWTSPKKKEPARESTTLVPEHKSTMSTMRHIPEDSNLQILFHFISVQNYASFIRRCVGVLLIVWVFW
jgi:hypothetical protein